MFSTSVRTESINAWPINCHKSVPLSGVTRETGCATTNNVHPSRHGTYDGISFHPFETIFVKSSWHVSDPNIKRYDWRLKL